MQEITLDAEGWKGCQDFYDAMFRAIGAPSWHGTSVNALIDSMLWGGVNALEPPYRVKVINTRHLPADVMDELMLARKGLAIGREDFRLQEGHDVGVSFEIAS